MDEELLRQRRREKILARSGLSPAPSAEKAELTLDPSQDYKKIQQLENSKVIIIQKVYSKIRCYVIFLVGLLIGFLSVQEYLMNPFYLFLMSYIPYRSIRGFGYFIGADNYAEMHSIQKVGILLELISELMTEVSLCVGGIILSLGLLV